ncbi:hypothetical protein AVEN_273370-1 [Araneus ventricosus]|uniref:Uncharacterized protein n=1 Tax=Araneus ventricosus TaxID=182803 RepID=A0A4Y2R6B7_ARAVE|nr:hypothetical protein AVEN_242385-1 [Araneus ventricosus]GBN71302.1 hypothetical protein AVEN_273370-1 [Araneus ventricosus]
MFRKGTKIHCWTITPTSLPATPLATFYWSTIPFPAANISLHCPSLCTCTRVEPKYCRALTGHNFFSGVKVKQKRSRVQAGKGQGLTISDATSYRLDKTCTACGFDIHDCHSVE